MRRFNCLPVGKVAAGTNKLVHSRKIWIAGIYSGQSANKLAQSSRSWNAAIYCSRINKLMHSKLLPDLVK